MKLLLYFKSSPRESHTPIRTLVDIIVTLSLREPRVLANLSKESILESILNGYPY